MSSGQRFNLFVSRASSSLLWLCIFVILWGAFVRFSRSGDGCGESWPLCDGSFVPAGAEVATWIEYTHRITSGMFGVGIFALFLYVFFLGPKRSPLRKFAAGAFIFTVSEALIGAGLVLRGLVGDNGSIERAVWLVGHLTNTLLLLYFLVALSVQARLRERELPLFPSFLYALPLLVFLMLAITGSLASLSNTLYQSSSLAEGILSDFSDTSPLLVRLRIVHPLFGILFFGLVVYWWRLLFFRFPRLSEQVLWLVGGNVLVGAATLLFLSPLAGKLTHLFLADMIWIQLVVGALVLCATRGTAGARASSPQLLSALEPK